MWRRGLLIGLLVLGSASGVDALEPQAIVGAWVGEWSDGLGVREAVYMTVTRVFGERVEGTVYWHRMDGFLQTARRLAVSLAKQKP